MNFTQCQRQSPDLNPSDHVVQFPKTKMNAENPTHKQQLKAAAAKALAKYLKDGNPNFVVSMGSRQAVPGWKGFTFKY